MRRSIERRPASVRRVSVGSIACAVVATIVATASSAAGARSQAASAAGPGESAGSLDFDRVFNDRGEPARSHYQAEYRLQGATHRLEVWRDGERRIKRRTDASIETYLDRPPASDEWSMTVLDLGKRVRTDVSRTNLMRIGHFTDWFAQGHALSRPIGTYALTPLDRGAPAIAAIGPCRWYRLAQGARTSDICWSASHRVPLVVADDAGRVQWRVVALEAGTWPASTFRIDDRGFARNDANDDIQAD